MKLAPRLIFEMIEYLVTGQAVEYWNDTNRATINFVLTVGSEQLDGGHPRLDEILDTGPPLGVALALRGLYPKVLPEREVDLLLEDLKEEILESCEDSVDPDEKFEEVYEELKSIDGASSLGTDFDFGDFWQSLIEERYPEQIDGDFLRILKSIEGLINDGYRDAFDQEGPREYAPRDLSNMLSITDHSI